MRIEKVRNVKIGEWIKLNDIKVVCQKHDGAKIIVSKQENSPYTFSFPYYSSDFNDLENRVEVF